MLPVYVGQAAFSFAVLCIIMLHCPVFAAHFLTWFGHDSPAGQFVSVRSFLIATTT